MTNEEYSDLKYKIVARENRYFLIGIVVAMFFAFITIGFLKQIINPFDFGWGMIAFGLGGIAITLSHNPWREKKKELNRLFKSKSSYEEAEKKLDLKYEPPKDGIYLTPTPVYPAFFIIEKVYIFPIVN